MRKWENTPDSWKHLDTLLTLYFLSLFIKTSFCIMLDNLFQLSGFLLIEDFLQTEHLQFLAIH